MLGVLRVPYSNLYREASVIARPSPPYDPLLGIAKQGFCLVCGRRKAVVYWRKGQLPVASLSYVEGWGLVHPECAIALKDHRGLEVMAGSGGEAA